MKRQAIYTTHDSDSLTELGRDWNFHDADTSQLLHSLHPYPAKFIPQIPRKAIQQWSKRGQLVYDPFCWCGTTLLEAAFLGRSSIGTDSNDVAVLVSRAKTARYSPTDEAVIRKFLESLGKFEEAPSGSTAHRRLIPTNKNFLYWFSEGVLDRLALLKQRIGKVPEPARTLLLASFSAILVRASFQDSDTRYARIQRDVKPADVNRLFKAKLRDVLSALPELVSAVRSDATIYHSDARSVPDVGSDSVDLIVTSPPYLNAYDYHKYHRQRLHWINGDFEFARDSEIGSHDEFTRSNATADNYFTDMDACFAEWSRVLKRGARCVVVIGDAIVSKAPVQVADTFVSLLDRRKILLESRVIRTLKPTSRAFNVSNSRITHEHVLVLRRA